jgi:hypothetical protein
VVAVATSAGGERGKLVGMTPPSLDVAREILAAEAARLRAEASDPRSAAVVAAIDVVLGSCLGCGSMATPSQAEGHPPWLCGACTEIRRRPIAHPLVVPFFDESGRQIGDASLVGCEIIGRITNEHAAAVLRSSTRPLGVSVGYRVEPARARPAIAEPAPGPGAPRVLCGLPVGGGSCVLPYGHGGHTQDGGCERFESTLSEPRLREIAAGEYGPNRQEGKAMANEIIDRRYRRQQSRPPRTGYRDGAGVYHPAPDSSAYDEHAATCGVCSGHGPVPMPIPGGSR